MFDVNALALYVIVCILYTDLCVYIHIQNHISYNIFIYIFHTNSTYTPQQCFWKDDGRPWKTGLRSQVANHIGHAGRGHYTAICRHDMRAAQHVLRDTRNAKALPIVPGKLRHHLHNRFYHFNDTDVHEAAAFVQIKGQIHKLVLIVSLQIY